MFFEDKLIAAVKKYRLIYDKGHDSYRDKIKREKAWNAIAVHLNVSGVDRCQTRWRTLRDRYVKEMNRRLKPGHNPTIVTSWKYMESLSFLDEILTKRPAMRKYEVLEVGDVLEEFGVETLNPLDVADNSNNSFSFGGSGGGVDGVGVDGGGYRTPVSLSMKTQVAEETRKLFYDVIEDMAHIVEKKIKKEEGYEDVGFHKFLESQLSMVDRKQLNDIKMEILGFVASKVKQYEE